MNTRTLTLLLALGLAACGSSSEPATEAPSADLLALAADGSTFDPPVAAERIPEGAWYCDMGTVHYARPDKGDGTCPVCGMNLSQKPGGGHDHDHDHHHE